MEQILAKNSDKRSIGQWSRRYFRKQRNIGLWIGIGGVVGVTYYLSELIVIVSLIGKFYKVLRDKGNNMFIVYTANQWN